MLSVLVQVRAPFVASDVFFSHSNMAFQVHPSTLPLS